MLVAGFAVGNVIPILISYAGSQKAMPASQAIGAVTVLGYLGILMRPPLAGYAAEYVGLGMAFFGLAGLMLVVASLSIAALRKV